MHLLQQTYRHTSGVQHKHLSVMHHYMFAWRGREVYMAGVYLIVWYRTHICVVGIWRLFKQTGGLALLWFEHPVG